MQETVEEERIVGGDLQERAAVAKERRHVAHQGENLIALKSVMPFEFAFLMPSHFRWLSLARRLQPQRNDRLKERKDEVGGGIVATDAVQMSRRDRGVAD